MRYVLRTAPNLQQSHSPVVSELPELEPKWWIHPELYDLSSARVFFPTAVIWNEMR